VISIEFDKIDAPAVVADSVYQLIAHLGRLIVVNTRGGFSTAKLLRT
jgi:hypothetical protein